MEVIRLLGLNSKGKPLSEKHCKAISDALSGKPKTLEHRLATAKSQIGRKHSPATIQKLRDSHKGYTRSEESKEKQKKTLAQRKGDPALEAIRVDARRKAWETRRRNGTDKLTDEQKKHSSEVAKEIWSRPGYREKMSMIHSKENPHVVI